MSEDCGDRITYNDDLEEANAALHEYEATIAKLSAEVARLKDNLAVSEMWQSTWQQKSMEQSAEVARLGAELTAAQQEARTWKLRVDEAANMIDGLAAANEREAWVSVEERLPETGKKVEVVVFGRTTGKPFITIAEYIAPRSTLAENYLSEDCDIDFCDYDEATDTYWTPSGWYEYQTMADVNYYINLPVTHWKPLPPPPTQEVSGE